MEACDSLCTDVPPPSEKLGRRDVSLHLIFSEGGGTSFHMLPFTGKKRYAKKQLLSTLLYLTQVWIGVYSLVVLQLCFDAESRVWLGIR